MRMKWPPIKSWTSRRPINGYRHFVAINYGGIGPERWINMVSVLDGRVRLKVSWSEVNSHKIWLEGWGEKESNTGDFSNHSLESESSATKLNQVACLHPSEDSGLSLPVSKRTLRTWS